MSLRLTTMETLGVAGLRKPRQKGTRFFKENADALFVSSRLATLETLGVVRLCKCDKDGPVSFPLTCEHVMREMFRHPMQET